MTEVITEQYDKELQQWILSIIKKSLKGKELLDHEVPVLFHWVRHRNDPAYSFVPKKYRNF